MTTTDLQWKNSPRVVEGKEIVERHLLRGRGETIASRFVAGRVCGGGDCGSGSVDVTAAVVASGAASIAAIFAVSAAATIAVVAVAAGGVSVLLFVARPLPLTGLELTDSRSDPFHRCWNTKYNGVELLSSDQPVNYQIET
ncbi:Hypothetical predicted protein [Octopus vulgaris]|uniref:Uncharacterized protein n=1 Tax=Octopus vulgaris TaxID=6645 RepID=A0AA36AZ26_OCTVU|nr:Hypothetical predicted protein [Octopus vulgaris]